MYRQEYKLGKHIKAFIRPFIKNVKNTMVKLDLIDPFRKSFREIEFETTTYCNRKCVYCPNSKYERPGSENGRYMSEKVFEKLLKDLSEIGFNGLIAPHLFGEPLTDPRLTDWISRIRTTLKNCTIKVVTNGDFLNKKIYTELINAGVNYFYLSKHSPELPQAVLKLLNAMDEKKRKKINILDFHNDYKNEQRMLNTRGGDIKLKKNLCQPICCKYATYPVINTFGDVILCCNDFHSRYISGNIMTRHLSEIWQDPQNIKLRKRIYKGNFDLPICQNCWL
ncbi:MAG: radical SAM/SPASM domain-containing protein [Planctomycetota bacterium]|jgi:radical SAM protein with 4Fe4S-binding SPASM domain